MLWSINITPYSYPRKLEKKSKAHHDAINKTR